MRRRAARQTGAAGARGIAEREKEPERHQPHVEEHKTGHAQPAVRVQVVSPRVAVSFGETAAVRPRIHARGAQVHVGKMARSHQLVIGEQRLQQKQHTSAPQQQPFGGGEKEEQNVAGDEHAHGEHRQRHAPVTRRRKRRKAGTSAVDRSFAQRFWWASPGTGKTGALAVAVCSDASGGGCCCGSVHRSCKAQTETTSTSDAPPPYSCRRALHRYPRRSHRLILAISSRDIPLFLPAFGTRSRPMAHAARRSHSPRPRKSPAR
eukprot:ctg_214.g137